MQNVMNPKYLPTNQAHTPMVEFIPPRVEKNETVLFYDQCHRGAHQMAYVASTSAMGDGRPGPTVTLLVVTGAGRLERKTSVRHIDDPNTQRPELKTLGAWEHAPLSRHLREIHERLDGLESLRARLDRLEQDLGVKKAEKQKIGS